jgi:hypothetical protein
VGHGIVCVHHEVHLVPTSFVYEVLSGSGGDVFREGGRVGQWGWMVTLRGRFLPQPSRRRWPCGPCSSDGSTASVVSSLQPHSDIGIPGHP